MKPRNKKIYNADQAVLAELRAEYEMLGFETRLDPGELTVYARKRKEQRRKRSEH